jgi:NAD+ synthase (glutamine-hydrolysing)
VERQDPALIQRVLNMINRNEYKRYQAPPVLRISSKSFGDGRKMPVVAKY